MIESAKGRFDENPIKLGRNTWERNLIFRTQIKQRTLLRTLGTQYSLKKWLTKRRKKRKFIPRHYRKEKTNNKTKKKKIIDTKCFKGSRENGPTKGRPKSKVCPPTPEDVFKIHAPLPLGS